MIRVVGLDLSLRSTGIARVGIYNDGRVETFTTTVGRPAEARATLVQRWLRLDATRDQIVDEVLPAVLRFEGDIERQYVDLVVMEGPAFGAAANAGGEDLSGLRWLVLDALLSEAATVVTVAPSTLKAYATGDGRAPKREVLAAVRRHSSDQFTIPTGAAAEDVADAIALAAMGARALDHPIDSLPEQHTRAMRTPRWPSTERINSALP